MSTLTFASLGWAALLDTGICVACTFVFNTLRTTTLSRAFYSPKRRLNIPMRNKPPKLPAWNFLRGGWWTSLWMRDEDFVKVAGHDALFYVHFLDLGAWWPCVER